MIVTTDVPKVPPILVSANTIAALSGKAATTLLIIGFKTILMKIYKKSTNEKIPISAYIGISNYIILLIIYIIENFR